MYKSLSAPLAIQLELTEDCTHRCLHCYNYWRTEEKYRARDLSWDDAQTITDQIIEEKVFRVVITGGEPLINKRVLFKVAEKLRKADITTAINSNLILLVEDDAHRIKDLGIVSVLTSILGPTREIHDEITQLSGSFDRTIEGVRLLQKIGVRVSVNMVVTKKNNHLVKDTALFVKSIGFKNFFATKAGCPGNCSDFSDLRISIPEFRQYLEDLYFIKEAGLSVDVLEAYPLCGIKEINRYKFATNHRCLAGVTTMTIGVDGFARPCSHLDILCGNVIRQGIFSAWKDMIAWRGKEFLSNGCKECELLEKCGGGCKMETKTAGGRDPFISFEDIDYVCSQMDIKKSSDNLVVLPNKFRLNPKIKWRHEFFGSVVFIDEKEVCYLDLEATIMLSQLSFNKDYCLKEIDDEYGGGLENFLTQLYAKQFWVTA